MYLKSKQLLLLPKTDNMPDVIDLRGGTPNYRPIMIQAALSNRLQQVIKQYVQQGIEHHVLQFGFRKDRTVQEAALLVRLILERANRRKEPLMLTSKDCLKCYDRVPGWAMEYLYIQKGVPAGAQKLMKKLLEPGQ